MEAIPKVGDRVCIELQVVSKKSKEYKLGMYTYDQQVKFGLLRQFTDALHQRWSFLAIGFSKFQIIYLMQKAPWLSP